MPPILQGRLTNVNDPMTVSLRGMTTQLHLMNIRADNIAYADIPGFQRYEPVVSSFAEHLGHKGITRVVNTDLGRVVRTGRDLDLALLSKGYFQKRLDDGRIHLTRDGRFKLDKAGNLLSDDNKPILSSSGTPIQLPTVPESLNQIRINKDGMIEQLDKTTNSFMPVVRLGVASEDGLPLESVDVRQKFIEAGNTFIHEEFAALVLPKRNFQANRQMFLIQNQNLQRLIQELGRGQ